MTRAKHIQTLGYAFLATSGHRLAKPKPQSPSGWKTDAKQIQTLGYVFLATSGHRLAKPKPQSPSGQKTNEGRQPVSFPWEKIKR